MYKPIRDGIEKNMRSVIYNEVSPPPHLNNCVHCFWELRTQYPLPEDFQYHIIPDACVNILFNQINPEISAITAIQTEHKILNLGKNFHYVGIQLLPGVWQGNVKEIENKLVDKPYFGALPLYEINKKLVQKAHLSLMHDIFIQFIEDLMQQKIIVPNVMILKILANIDNIKNITDMARIVELSPRQLQRNLKQLVWLTPHNFFKILRVQQTFKQSYLDYYTDQAHFIHSFHKIIGYTPIKYNKKFDV